LPEIWIPFRLQRIAPAKQRARRLLHVAQKCAAVLGQRHASKQRPKARRLNPFQRDAL